MTGLGDPVVIMQETEVWLYKQKVFPRTSLT